MTTTDMQAPTEEQIVAAARALANHHADTCNVNREDNWMIYGDSFRESAEIALRAALASRPDAQESLASENVVKDSTPKVSQERAQADEPTAWRPGSETPPVKEGKAQEFILAVRRKHAPEKVFVFAANYANNFTDDGSLSGRDGEDFTAHGWYLCGLDTSGEFDEVYEAITLNEGDEILGWQPLPKWQEVPAAAPAPVSEPSPDREQVGEATEAARIVKMWDDGFTQLAGSRAVELLRNASPSRECGEPSAENAGVRNKIAAALHYPDHWDTAAYPTLDDAAWEAIAAAKLTCSECGERQECPHGQDDGACGWCYDEKVASAPTLGDAQRCNKCGEMKNHIRNCNDEHCFLRRSSQPQAAEPKGMADEQPSFTNPLTPYGMLVRALRIVAGTTLYDMAKALLTTPAKLSAMEFGRAPVTQEFAFDVSAYFDTLGVPDTLAALTVAANARALLANGE